MPLPSKGSLLPWQYTLLDDHTFSDGRTPDAATLVSLGSPYPNVVLAAPAPTSAGPWWLPQDLAHGGHLVVAVLHTSKIIGSLPVFERHLLDSTTSIDQVVAFDVQMPKYPSRDPAPLAPDVRALRRQLRKLLASDQNEIEVPDLEAVAEAINELHRREPSLPVTECRLALLRFRHPEAGHSSEWQTHAALLLESESHDSASEPSDAIDETHPGSIHLSQAEGYRRLGLLKAERGDLERARSSLQTAAEQGDIEAMVHLGQLSRQLPGVDNRETAFTWLRTAAEHGHPAATFFAGMMQAEIGQMDGDDGARIWWERAHERGIPEAAGLLAQLNDERGDKAQAERWWRIGAEQGDAEAALNVGLLLAEDRDSWPNDDGPDSAEAWWQKAHQLGSSRAACELGRRRLELGLFDGEDGADVWLRRAWEAGIRPSAFLLGMLRSRQDRLIGPDSALSWLEEIEDSGLPDVVSPLRTLRLLQGASTNETPDEVTKGP